MALPVQSRPARPLAKLDRTALGVWFGLAVLTAVFFYIHANFVQDDAYITYRYARNLSQGLGFVYNINEPVLGTTTPLFTLVLAAGARVTQVDVPTLSLVIGLMSLWISAGTLYQLGQAYSKGWALSIALIYLSNPLMSQFIGMESDFLVCLMLLAIWAYQRERLWLASMLCGLLVLVRYEMILLAGLLGALDAWRRRRPPVWLWLSLALVLPWLAYAWVQFGSPVPLSAMSKLSATRVPFLLGAAFYGYVYVNRSPAAFAIVILFALGVVGAFVLRRLPSGYALVVIFGLIYLAVASAVAGSFPWYYAPLLPAFAVLVTSGIQVLTELPAAARQGLSIPRRGQLVRQLRWPLAVGAVAIQLAFWQNDYVQQPYQAFDHRYTPYREIAQWLKERTLPQQTLASYEIGYLGYFSDMTIIDLEGLVTPGLSTWVKDGGDAMLTHALQLYTPDFVVVLTNDRSHVDILTQDPHYRLEREFDNAYLLYARAR